MLIFFDQADKQKAGKLNAKAQRGGAGRKEEPGSLTGFFKQEELTVLVFPSCPRLYGFPLRHGLPLASLR